MSKTLSPVGLIAVVCSFGLCSTAAFSASSVPVSLEMRPVAKVTRVGVNRRPAAPQSITDSPLEGRAVEGELVVVLSTAADHTGHSPKGWARVQRPSQPATAFWISLEYLEFVNGASPIDPGGSGPAIDSMWSKVFTVLAALVVLVAVSYQASGILVNIGKFRHQQALTRAVNAGTLAGGAKGLPSEKFVGSGTIDRY